MSFHAFIIYNLLAAFLIAGLPLILSAESDSIMGRSQMVLGGPKSE